MSIEIDKKKIPKRDRRIMKFYRKAVDRFRKEIDLCENAGKSQVATLKQYLNTHNTVLLCFMESMVTFYNMKLG